MPRCVLLAYGNPMRTDDGVAWTIAEAVERDPDLNRVQVHVTQQLTPELAQVISEAHTVAFVDCSAVAPAGSIAVFDVVPADELPTALTHYLTPSSLLTLCRAIYGTLPHRAFSLTVGGESFEWSAELTESASKAVPEAVEKLKCLFEEATCL